MTLAVLGCALLYGQLGLVSLCQWALVGVGGWVSLRVYHSIHPPFFVTILAGGVGASVIGMIWGLPALRMRGLYLALVTLMLAGAFQTLVIVISFPVGGPGFLGQVGASGNDRINMARPIFASSDTGYFLFVAVVTVLCIFLVEAHRRTKPGTRLGADPQERADGDRGRRAGSCSTRPGHSRCRALSPASPARCWPACSASSTLRRSRPTNSIVIFIGTLLGGYEVWLGAFLGGMLTRFIPALLIDLNVNTNVGFMIFGAALVVCLARSARPRRPTHDPGRASLRQIPGAARAHDQDRRADGAIWRHHAARRARRRIRGADLRADRPQWRGQDDFAQRTLRLRHAGQGHDSA